MENKICIYAITKNEEKFVDRWYESMKEADSIVVLDTGSTDNTVKKLKELGVTVETKIIDPWRFDVARNESLKLVPDDCNILFCTDLDEVLEPGWSKVLKERWIDGYHERAIYKYTWSHLEDGSEGRVFKYNKIHSRNWKWRSPVHELLYNINTNSNEYEFNKSLYLFDEIHLHHYPDMNKSRSSYLPLLELRAKENPDDYYGLIYLAHEYYYRNMNGKSIKLLNDILNKFSDKCTDLEIASCYLFIGDNFSKIADNNKDKELYYEAIYSYLEAIKIDNTYIEPYLNLSKVYLSLNDYSSAEFYTKQGIKNSYRHYTWLERDTSWSYEPWDILCRACYYGDNKKDSIIYAAKALSFEPNNKRLKDNLDICIKLTNDKELL